MTAAYCPRCLGRGFMCEDHPDQPMDHDGCRGAGVPCEEPGCPFTWIPREEANAPR